MHIIIRDNNGDDVATVCVDRTTKHCQILHCQPDLIGQATAIARSLGVPRVFVMVGGDDEAEEYGSVGFQDAGAKVMVRRFDG